MTARRYQVLPDQAYCLHPGCSWRETGRKAEDAAEQHTGRDGHETQVLTAAKVIFTKKRPATVAL